MAGASPSEQDWRIRAAIYRHFVEQGSPPDHVEIARRFAIPIEEARASFRRLHAHHALFLEPGGETIRMANPLSAVPTAYEVHAAGRRLWANCAWDSLGIPAMLHDDAEIRATLPRTGEVVGYAVEAGRLRASGGVVHFARPFRRWYDDLIHT